MLTADSKQSWIAVVRPRNTAPAVPPAVAAELVRRGRAAKVVMDGDPAILEADAVLLMGSLGSMRRTARLLGQRRDKRPFVVAWVSEPLPPPGLPRRVLDIAEALSPVHIGTRWAKPLMSFLGYPAMAAFRRFALPAKLRREIRVPSLRMVLDNLSFIRIGLKKGWIDAVAVSTEQKRRYLADLGIESTFMPVGKQAGFGRLIGGERDIDLLFIGNIKSERRRRALDAIFAEARKRGLTAYIPDKPIFGEDRTELVNRARVMLHLHNFRWDTPWMRWNLALANGAVIASEPLSVPDPLRPGTDYLSATIEDLPAAIEALARDEDRRRKMLEDCHATMDREMTLEISIGKFLKILDGRAKGESKQ